MANRTVPDAATARGCYAGLTADRQAAYTREMLGEVLDHYEQARTLVRALLNELRDVPASAKGAQHLASVVDTWLNDSQHLAQEQRLSGCVESMCNSLGV